ncbi:MAG TPA: hypothetical protein VF544_20885 [Pyrinomonadaceae bacterium]|jgi:hypothetical protein
MRNTLDEHRTHRRSIASLARRRPALCLFALLLSLFASTRLTLPGGAGHAQGPAAQRAAEQTEVNVISWDVTGRTTQLAGVTASSGILVFDSLATYERAYPIILNMSAEQAQAWEKSVGFVSQRNLFNQIVEAEYQYLAAPYEELSTEELKGMSPPSGHTDIYEKYLRLGIIKTERDEHGEETYTCAIPIGAYLPVINEQGFFVVGNTIYQIKGNLIKEMLGLDFSKLAALDEATEDDGGGRIRVQRVAENPRLTDAQAASGCSFPRTSGWITSGNRRGSITVNFSKTYFNPYPYTKVNIIYNVNVKSQKKNVWGSWVYAPCPNECWLSFTWTAAFDYINKTTLSYAGSTLSAKSFAYPHPNCINHFNGSFNPITGSTAPYPSSFTFTAPSGLAFQDVGFQSALWHASVPGGPSGINCNVGCP